jgi:NAD(P)-dependent dehydrogenase (short-subunit alcohol dehydrogenase family)
MRRRVLLGLFTVALAAYGYSHLAPRRRRWQGRVVIITGGARGLGFALAREFAAQGAIVWLVSRSDDELARAVERLRATGARAHAQVADVTDPTALAGLVEAVVARHGRIDVIVNNAGVITAMPFANAEIDDFRESMDTHFWGPLHLTLAALPWLKRSRAAHIINISSIGGAVGVPHLAPYCAGKFALTGLSQVLRAELAPQGIWVTLATPGLMRTGSIGRVKVRGDHVAEARWFAALSATSLTSMSASRAARQIVDAAAQRRAAVTPGWQARLQQVAHGLAPGLAAAVLAAVAGHVLPKAVNSVTPLRTVSDLDLGWAQALVSIKTAVEYNQPEVVRAP